MNQQWMKWCFFPDFGNVVGQWFLSRRVVGMERLVGAGRLVGTGHALSVRFALPLRLPPLPFALYTIHSHLKLISHARDWA